jgi:hypothetical protein
MGSHHLISLERLYCEARTLTETDYSLQNLLIGYMDAGGARVLTLGWGLRFVAKYGNYIIS